MSTETFKKTVSCALMANCTVTSKDWLNGKTEAWTTLSKQLDQCYTLSRT